MRELSPLKLILLTFRLGSTNLMYVNLGLQLQVDLLNRR